MRRKIRWVPEAAVRAIHAALIAEHGGQDGLRDPGLLSSALARPRNARFYGKDATVFDLAAAYAGGISGNHPFIDGNKRTALMVAYVFLSLNGHRLVATEVDAVVTMMALAGGEKDENSLSDWFRDNSETIRL